MSEQRPDRDRQRGARRLEPEEEDLSYPAQRYFREGDQDEDVRDLGFIVEDHDDRRAHLTGGWQRLDDLDTDEPLETNRSGRIPHETSLRERGAPEEWFVTDYHVSHADAESQEEEFVETSMLDTDPGLPEGRPEPDLDFTDETIRGIHGELTATNITGRVRGVGDGFGTSLPQDGGLEGFKVRDNPLVQPEGQPISDDMLGLESPDELEEPEEAFHPRPRAAPEPPETRGPGDGPRRPRR